MKTINFSRVDKAKFFRTLNKRVNTYFKENDIKYENKFEEVLDLYVTDKHIQSER